MKKIKILGDYEEIKDILLSLPLAKQGKYLYVIFAGNNSAKFGVTENPAKRILDHERGFAKYGNTKIKSVLITNICLEYDKLENNIKTFFATKNNTEITEWLKADDIMKIYKDIFDIINKYLFIEVKSIQSFISCLYDKIYLYFSSGNESYVNIDREQIQIIIKENYLKCNKRSAFKMIKKLHDTFPEYIQRKDNGMYEPIFCINRGILNKDIPSS